LHGFPNSTSGVKLIKNHRFEIIGRVELKFLALMRQFINLTAIATHWLCCKPFLIPKGFPRFW